jgi:hypothetical protein
MVSTLQWVMMKDHEGYCMYGIAQRYNHSIVGGDLLRMKSSGVFTLTKGMSDGGFPTRV